MSNLGTYETRTSGLECQTLYYNYGVSGTTGILQLTASNTYQIHPTLWGSLVSPSVNIANVLHRSRLTGRIFGCSIAYSAQTGSGEPIQNFVRIWPKKYPVNTSISEDHMIGTTSFRSNQWPMTGSASPAFLPCDIPIQEGDLIALKAVCPSSFTKAPRNVNWTYQLFIQGVSERTKSTYKSTEFGYKTSDAYFNSAANNNFANGLTYRFAYPQFNTGLITGTTFGNASQPYTGYITGVTMIVLNAASTTGSGERIRIFIDKVPPEQAASFGVSKSLDESHFLTDLDLRPLQQHTYIPCKIPINRGQGFHFKIQTPTWSIPPTNIRPCFIAHISGV